MMILTLDVYMYIFRDSYGMVSTFNPTFADKRHFTPVQTDNHLFVGARRPPHLEHELTAFVTTLATHGVGCTLIQRTFRLNKI